MFLLLLNVVDMPAGWFMYSDLLVGLGCLGCVWWFRWPFWIPIKDERPGSVFPESVDSRIRGRFEGPQNHTQTEGRTPLARQVWGNDNVSSRTNYTLEDKRLEPTTIPYLERKLI